MSRVRILMSKNRPARTLGVLLTATSLIALLVAGAGAQQALPQRDNPYGTGTAATSNNTSNNAGPARKAAPAAAAEPVPAYQPVSPGATPDPPTTTRPTSGSSLFGNDDDAQADDDTSAEAPLPTRVPSTAKSRTQARKGLTSEEEQAPATRRLTTDQQEEADAKAETELNTGTVKTPRANADDILPIEERPQRESAIEGLRPLSDETPFAAPGIRVGTFILRPSLESGVTTSTNADSSVGGGSAVLSETTLRLNAVSDWSRHSATIDAYGTYRKTLSGEEIDETEAGIDATLNLDLAEDLRGIATLGYVRSPDSASSAVVIADTVSQPILQTFSASAGLAKDVGKVRLGVTGRVAHDDYGDADLSDGTVLSQEDRNTTLATVILRGGYEISPAITPFAELEVGKRHYDQSVDSSGYERSANRLGVRGGVALDLNEKLLGELSAGWISENPEDDRLDSISGLSVAADLRWSLERGTTLALAASTFVEPTTTPGESGSLLHEATLTLEREIHANLTANAAVGAGYRNYTGVDGHDTLLNAQVGATWWLNRYAGLTGRLRYEQLHSNLEGRDYDATSAFLGLRLQR